MRPKICGCRAFFGEHGQQAGRGENLLPQVRAAGLPFGQRLVVAAVKCVSVFGKVECCARLARVSGPAP